MRIEFDAKFTSRDLTTFINVYYEKSMNASEVIFSMKKLEWIAVEELTFLFGWIRNVKFNNEKLKMIFVELPTINQTEPEDFKDEKEKDETIRRRRTRLISLVENWKIISACGLAADEININRDINSYLGKSHLTDNNWHSIIPFKAIPFLNYHSYNELRENIKSEVEGKFKLQERTIKLLTSHTTKSIFDNKTLSNIITTELYLNSLHHSFNPDPEFENKECYFSISLRNKIDIAKYIETKKKEGLELTTEAAEKKIQGILSSNSESERIKIERNYFKSDKGNQIRNDTFIEFTFLDFGKGIPSTLRKKYREELNDAERRELLKQQLSDKHFESSKSEKVNEDSLIIEYAFLLHSSSNPFNKQLQINDYVPRGLFFLIDMVKRYNGMVVVKSNNGCVSYSFDDTSKPTKDCISFSEETNDNFPGTLISIYIPAEVKDKRVKVNAVERVLTQSSTSQKREIKYIGISEILKESNQFQKQTSELQINGYYDKTFEILNDSLDKYNQEPTLLIVDFAGCDSSIIDHKIYYYLSNTPKINFQTTLVIINGTDKNVITDVQKSIAISDDLLFRPIPCIISKEEVIWIGIKNLNDEPLLNKLWQYADGGFSEAASEFKNTDQLKGNVIEINWIGKDEKHGNISVFIPSKDKVFEYYSYDYTPKKYLKQILFKEEKHKVLRRQDNTVYWTSGGYYQTEFIRFIEKLYEINLGTQTPTKYPNDFEFGRKVSEYLIRKFELLKGDLNFDYIVSVTLSSQLLANSVRNIYCELKGIPKGEEPQIIRLANYYEFTTEKAFKKIEKGKKVLIVNDVISTGKLSNEIYESLIVEKDANVVGIFSLVDSRQPKNEKWEIDHFYFESIDDNTIWLLKYPVKKYAEYRTIDKKYENDKPKIISIDPVINTPNTMSYQRSDTDRLIYSDFATDSVFDSKNFLQKFEDPNRLWVGHLHHNVAHHSYYFRLHNWFESESGKNLIKQLITEIKNNYQSKSFQDENKKRRKNVLSFIGEELKKFENYFSTDENIKVQYQNVINELNSLEELTGNDSPLSNIETDIIFYPMYSGSEVFNRDDYRDIFEIKEHSKFILFPLGRVDSPKGWRFTFPPKVLNEITESYKNVFIIDDGTCTGETLMQTIDSVAFLNVNRITVLSVVGRLEDFQREFFTRLHSIKVKYEQKKNPHTKEREVKDRVVPLSIYFGVHFHIQVYPAFTDVCPFCEEERTLKKELESKNVPIAPVKEYIKKRLDEIKLFDTDGSSFENPSDLSIKYSGLPPYIPSEIDRYKLFEYRDKIGKLASYRTFAEYLQDFDNNDWEIWIAILLHEPKLIKIIDQLLPSLKRSLINHIERIITFKNKEPLKYKWHVYDIVRFYSIILGTNIFKYETFKQLIKYSSTSSKKTKTESEFETTIQFIIYFAWKNLKFPEKKERQLKKPEIIFNIEKYWIKDLKPNEKILKEDAGNAMRFNYLRNLLRFTMQEKEKAIPAEPQYSFSKIKTFYLKLQSEYPNHVKGFLIDFNKNLKWLQKIKNNLNNNIPIEESTITQIKSSTKSVFNDYKDILISLIESSSEVIRLTSIYDRHIKENGILKTSKRVETKVQELALSSLSKDVIGEIITDLETLQKIYLSGEEEFAKYFINHDPILINIINECVDKFNEGNSDDLNNYNVVIDCKRHNKISDEQINIHPELLNIVFDSLFDNALKHTKKHFDYKPQKEAVIIASFDYKKKDDFVEILHKQNIKNKNEIGSGYDDINLIVQHFGGKVTINTKSHNFEVEILLPISKLQINEENE
ncbi:MAG: phosphoribosyltransferase [Bacteroidetes bacterium]|nr:phosphoribosyltransferase [Bacteroidota bacterium]